MPRNRYWDIYGGELEEHLANDCELTILKEPSMLTENDLTPEERDLLYQFPSDSPEVPKYDDILLEPLENETAELDLYAEAMFTNKEAVGVAFKTSRFWVLRVKNA